ncbi:pentatricopeptide repeat-containing protein At1g05750, chloroplastic [Abrus precatorius]|uniref:Pentatricopeptide repeat-containing protein At1g05750, chloroplastic n=1 Tax=Abrus precatorius TaxID=3816 RepID=A0A8B8KGG2_ABRPR|nr:pentatricopeptide repeat-containing protein At1g05750, chloroplastic [Abrus precatorius]
MVRRMILPACTTPPKPACPIPLPNQTHSTFSPTKPNTSQSLSLRHIDPTVGWTYSIAHHCRSGHLVEAASEFVRMREAGVEPNHITLITLLSACAHSPSHATISFGATIHAHARKLGLDKNVMVGTALVDMYAKCGRVGSARLAFDHMGVRNLVSWNTMIDGYMRNGEIKDALQVFDELPVKNAISWTALIGGFVKKDYHEEALECFREMQLAGVAPDYVTVIAVLAACANLGTLVLGMWVHRLVMAQDFRNNVRVCNSLIDMYSRCGCIELAHQVFDRMPQRTVVSWNSIVVGFAVNGLADEALNFFNSMQKEGFEPDGVSYTGALTACSHAGLIDEGLRIFDKMKRVRRIVPRIEHYGCLVDLYSRAGRLEDALDVIKNMPMKPNKVVLGSLLAACRTQGEVELAENVTNYLIELHPEGESIYVLLSNIYAAVGKWDGANKVRRRMKDRGIQKKPGFSSIEIDSSIHKFVAGDKSHEENDCIYSVLGLLSFELQLCGYVPDSSGKESYEDG